MKRTPRQTETKRLGALFVIAAVIVALNVRDEGQGVDLPTADSIATRTPADLIARGEYLARAGDCIACHTARGGVPYAGGRGIETPFGTVYAPNLTPDPQTGLGNWSASDFWRALHNGRSRDGRLLYPVFPYPNYTRVRASRLGMRFTPTCAACRRSGKQPAAHVSAFRSTLQTSTRHLARLFQARCLHARSARPPNGTASLSVGGRHRNACHSSRNALGCTDRPARSAGGLSVQTWYARFVLTGGDDSGRGRLGNARTSSRAEDRRLARRARRGCDPCPVLLNSTQVPVGCRPGGNDRLPEGRSRSSARSSRRFGAGSSHRCEGARAPAVRESLRRLPR